MWVKSIQTAGYNGARTVYIMYCSYLAVVGPNNEVWIYRPIAYDACQVESGTLAQVHLRWPRYLCYRVCRKEKNAMNIRVTSFVALFVGFILGLASSVINASKDLTIVTRKVTQGSPNISV